jgi:short-subunit dehydrogenase
MQLDSRRVLLTGATGGLGHAIARALAARGAQLVLTGRRTDVLQPLAREVGGRAVAAGSGPVLDYTTEQIDRALAVNLRAPMLLARLLAEPMAARGSGHLAFVSSLSGKAASPGSGIYSATKFGLRGFALGLREDLHGSGVGVSTIFPGFIRGAGMFAESGAQLPFYAGTKTPEDVGAAVVRAIERDRAEVDVAPLSMRVGAALTGLLPAPLLAAQRRLGANKVSEAMAEGQRAKR